VARTDWEQIIGKAGRQELLRFQLEMIKVRAGLGWQHRDLRAALKGLGNNSNPEMGSLYWQMANVQDWCQVLGGRLLIRYEGLPTPDPNELEAVMQKLKALFKQDEFERWFAVHLLAQCRIAAGMSTEEMGKLIGLSSSGVGHWENETDNPMIPGLMRHAHALGGTVHLDFVPVEPVKGPTGRKK
jgi:DNA-binding XRE family transcriptional regulator